MKPKRYESNFKKDTVELPVKMGADHKGQNNMHINAKKNSISVSVYFLGDELLPSDVTQILGIEPSSERVKGESWKTSSGSIVVPKTGRWVLRSNANNRVDSDDLADHIRYIAEVFKNKGEDIKKLKNIDKAFIDIYICSGIDEDPKFYYDFSVEEMKFFASLSLPLIITAEFADD